MRARRPADALRAWAKAPASKSLSRLASLRVMPDSSMPLVEMQRHSRENSWVLGEVREAWVKGKRVHGGGKDERDIVVGR